ncbi:MAG: porin [Pirellulales bacterium]
MRPLRRALSTALLSLVAGSVASAQSPRTWTPGSNDPGSAIETAPVLQLQEAGIGQPIADPVSRITSSTPVRPASVFSQTLTAEDIEAIVDMRLAEKEAEAAKKEEEKKSIAPGAASDKPDLSMTGKWNNGLEWATKDKDFKVHVGGRYQMDNSWFSADQSVQNNINIPYADGIDFRRARFRIEGTMYKYIDWTAECDFVNSFRANASSGPGFTENSTVALTDFWWQCREVPFFGTVRVGQQKEAIGFEHLVSSRFLPFMERSYNQDAFYGGLYNGFTPGVAAFRNYGDQRGVIHYGLYKPVNNVFGYNTGDGDYSVVGRVTHLLGYADEGRRLIHVGVSGKQATAVSQAGIPGRSISFRTRDAIRAGFSQDWPVPAGITLFGDDIQQVNTELVAVNGRWTFQSEYMVSAMQDARLAVGDPLGNNVVYHGGYLQLLCFLTDDHDHYNKQTGVLERLSPSNNFSMKNPCGRFLGGGAWQVGARYNYIDLNDIGLNGGALYNQTYGLNWFLNPNMKCQLNYIQTYRDVSDTTRFPGGSGWVEGFGGRIACDF